MGFISSEINKEHDKYILLGDIIRLVGILEGGTCSLQEIATFLLKKYEDNCFDDNCLIMLINLHLEGELEDIYILMKLGIYTNSFVLFSDMADLIILTL